MQTPSLATSGPYLNVQFNFPKRGTQLAVTPSGWGLIFRKQVSLVPERERASHTQLSKPTFFYMKLR